MKIRKYSIEQLKTAVENSTSFRQVMIKLGLAPKGGNYQTLHRLVNKYNISVLHFSGKGWNKGKSNNHPPIKIEDKLVNGYYIQSYKLKKQLFKLGIKFEQCETCGLTEWLGNPAPLQLDHIDGNCFNNELNNLRILCANCHALTPTFAGKNKRIIKDISTSLVPEVGLEPTIPKGKRF